MIVGCLIIIIMSYLFEQNYSDQHYETVIETFEATTNAGETSIYYERNIDEFQSRSEASSTAGEIIDPFNKEIQIEEYESSPAYALLHIPKLGELLPIYLGASPDNLINGVAVIEGTGTPEGGLHTRSVISGHRGYAGKTLFLNLNYLAQGDLIHVIFNDNYLTYEVYESEEIGPDETQRLAPISGEDILSLLTCTPIPTFHNRLVVNARRVGNSNAASVVMDTPAEAIENNLTNEATELDTEEVIYTEEAVSDEQHRFKLNSTASLVYNLQNQQPLASNIEDIIQLLNIVRLIFLAIIMLLGIRLLMLIISSLKERGKS